MSISFKHSKTAVAVSMICSSLFLGGCGSDKKTDVVIVEPEPVPGMFDNVQGHWNKLGYGEFIHIGADKIEMFEFNEYGCVVTDTVTHDEAEEAIKEIKKTDVGRLSVLLNDSLRATVYHPSDALPASCNEPLTVSSEVSPEVTFEFFWHAFNDYYAFFDARNVDWQLSYQTYRPMVTAQTTRQELFDIFSLMIEPLRDAHTSIESEDDDFSVEKTIPFENAMFATIAQFHRGGHEATFDEIKAWFYQRYMQIQKGYVTDESFGTYPQDAAYPTMLWGKTANNVGVLVINDMFSFARPGEQIGENGLPGIVEAANEQMALVMEQLKDTDGLILDIRLNEGGADDISLAIAQYFANKEVNAFHKQAETRVGQGHSTVVTLVANEQAYTKPVYLLTSQQTTSAAEIFTMAMKELDHVTQVGEETSGALSDVLTLILPNGWEMSLSNEVYRDSQGQTHEVSGLQPDVHAWAYTLESMGNGKFESYEAALKAMGKWQKPTLSQDNFEAMVNQLMVEGKIPGAALAVVKSGEVVYQNGFGKADESGRAVTADTPFYLASVSKTLLGTTMAEVEADNLLSIDDAVKPLLDFSLDYPAQPDFEPTLRHLVTHTSGIIDQPETFLCSYYLMDDHSSLFQLVDSSLNCDDYIESDLAGFFTHYLQQGGDKYQQGNFTSSMGYGPDQVTYYSNIATALSGYAMEQKVGKPLPTLTREYVFNALDMNQSYWSIEGEPEDLALRYYFDQDSGKPLPIPDYAAVTYADGSAISSAADMAKYMAAVMNDGVYQGRQLLTKAAVQKMLTRQSEVATSDRGVGYFWRLDGDYISHDGGDPGVRSQIWADKNADVAIVLLTNGDTTTNEATSLAFGQINALLKQFAYSL